MKQSVWQRPAPRHKDLSVLLHPISAHSAGLLGSRRRPSAIFTWVLNSTTAGSYRPFVTRRSSLHEELYLLISPTLTHACFQRNQRYKTSFCRVPYVRSWNNGSVIARDNVSSPYFSILLLTIIVGNPRNLAATSKNRDRNDCNATFFRNNYWNVNFDIHTALWMWGLRLPEMLPKYKLEYCT